MRRRAYCYRVGKEYIGLMKSLVSIAILVVLVLLGLLISFKSRQVPPAEEAVLDPVIIEENIFETPTSTTTVEDVLSASTTSSTTTATSTD